MAFSRYILWIIIQVLLIGITSLLFALAVTNEFMIVTKVSLPIIWAIQLGILIFYINKTRRDLLRFVDGLKNQDTSLMFKKEKKDRFFKALHEEFNEIMRDFKIIKKEKELESLFFQQIMEHIGIGILVFNDEGKILLKNKALLKLLNQSEISNIQELEQTKQNLPFMLGKIKNNEQKTFILENSGKKKNISIYASEFVLDSKAIKIISFQDISKEIDKTEVDAWNKLFRVITHEIMNSVSPIRLLSGGLIDICEDIELQTEKKQEISNGLQAIKKRAEGLSHFIEDYRKLTRLPLPEIKEFNISNSIDNVATLFTKELESKNIQLILNCRNKEQIINGDQKQIEQVLINLIRNSINALEGISNATIELNLHIDNKENTIIQITDNGSGISKEAKENMFIPFYSTKENGSGIGLSLSKQIINMHGGEISCFSENNKTVFRILL